MSHVAQHGPTPVSAKAVNGKIVIEFSDAVELMTSDGQPLRSLEIGGSVGTMEAVPNECIKFKDNTIIIEGFGKAQRVRYAWKPYTDANLVNETGLPASTFEIEISHRR
jgi:sialate O-acetylesterase